jgi:hypothetical protein
MTTQYDASQRGHELGLSVMAAIGDWQSGTDRSKQSAARQLGMSEMGGCREYIRASIAGEPKHIENPLKWAAFVGTAVGDLVEEILGPMGFTTQETAVVKIPGIEISVKGHLDLRDKSRVADIKTVDGTDTVQREGPSFKHQAQISGYLVAKVQDGTIEPEEATGHLVYLDRSGKNPDPFVWSLSYERALEVLDLVRERLLDVQHALATASREGRDGRLMTDEPESYCFAISCPFYNRCWEGYVPTGTIEHPRELDAVRRYIEARDEVNAAKGRQEGARADLEGVEGITLRGETVRWTITEKPSGGYSTRLDVRVPK